MTILNQLLELSTANRLVRTEELESGSDIAGDFQQNVTGQWLRLDGTGAGIVLYNQKEYVTVPLGFTSIPEGTKVEMSFANGTYYSKF